MAGTVVQVFFEYHSRPSENLNFELVETEFEDFAGFVEAADANRLICGSRLLSKPGDARGERIVTRREPIAFRGSVVERAQLPSYRLVEIE